MRYLLFLFTLLVSLNIAKGQNADIPDTTNPPRLVTDFAGFLSSEEVNGLENKLLEYNNTSSTQIAVVIVKSLNGYEPSDFGTRIIEKWGIGQKGKDNGILLLVKPKTADEDGKVAISTGYGVEHLVTDALARSIIDKEIIPAFKNGNNYRGIDNAVNTLISLTRGEFTADQYMAQGKQKKSGKGLLVIIIIIIIAIFSLFGNKGGGSHMSSKGDLPFWILMGMMGSRGSRGSFGGFSGGGGFGGGGGGFGGFGGGSGGGGGASGSW
jgi:uncharacterized protein